MALIFHSAINETRLQANVYRVSSGEEALAYLRGEGRYAGRIWPDIVFLDLNMPKVDGWQVLTAMRADNDLRSIPVVVLTTSSSRADKDRAQALGAQRFLTKPAAFGFVSRRCGVNVSIAGRRSLTQRWNPFR